MSLRSRCCFFLGLILAFLVHSSSQAPGSGHGDARNTTTPFYNRTGYRNSTSNATILPPDSLETQIFQLNGTYYSPRTHSNHSTPPLSPVPPHDIQVIPLTPSLSPDFLSNATLEEKRALEAYGVKLLLETNPKVSSPAIVDRGLYPVGEAWPCFCPFLYWLFGLDGPWMCGPIIANLITGLCNCCPEDQLCGYTQDFIPTAECLVNVIPTTPLTLPGPRLGGTPSGIKCPGGQYCDKADCCGNTCMPVGNTCCAGGTLSCGNKEYCSNDPVTGQPICVPDSGYFCSDGKYESFCLWGDGCCGNMCVPQGQTCCPGNQVICHAGTYCWDWGHYCIPDDQQVCEWGGQLTATCGWDQWCCGGQCGGEWQQCCPGEGAICWEDEVCCGDHCCPNGYTCCNDQCFQTGGTGTCCGDGACSPDHKCCGGECIWNDWTCCDNGVGCSPGTYCCGGGCCPNGQNCADGQCLDPGVSQCGDGHRCFNSQWCCGGTCGGPGDNGDSCCWDSNRNQEYLCGSGSFCCGSGCCNTGQTCQGGMCLEAGQTLCSDGHICAGGEWCCGSTCGGPGANGDSCCWSSTRNAEFECSAGTSCCGDSCCPWGQECYNGACLDIGIHACPDGHFCSNNTWCCGDSCGGPGATGESCCWSSTRNQEFKCDVGFQCCGDSCCPSTQKCKNDQCLPPGEDLCPFDNHLCSNNQWCCGASCGGPGDDGESCCWSTVRNQEYLCAQNTTCCGDSCATETDNCCRGSTTSVPFSCSKDNNCCGDSCCPLGQECCSTNANACCVVPTPNPSIDPWVYRGCYPDGTSRTLDHNTNDYAAMTVAECLLTMAVGYRYAGVEYGGECWYGNSLSADIHAASSGCDVTCNGNTSEACGGANRLSFYENLQYTPPAQQNPGVGDFLLMDCYTDNADFRDLPFSLIDYQGMTVEKCVQAAAGYRYAAVEYYGECYFGNVLATTAQPSTGCNTPCSGNPQEVCGGASLITLYSNTAFVQSQTVDDWQPLGCFTDNDSPRTIPANRWLDSSSMTIEGCQALAQGFRFFGINYGVSCWYGNYMNPLGLPLNGPDDCQVPCAGNPTQICGGNFQITVFSNKIFTPPSIAKWAALGDSYSAGPAAGTYLDDGDDPKRCLRYTGSYPVQMNTGATGVACVIQENEFKFLSCTGAKWEQTDDPGGSPLIGDQFQPLSDFGLGVDFVTLSSGGNDVFFARIVDNCLYQINWTTSMEECDYWINQAYDKLGGNSGAPGVIAEIIVDGYKSLLDRVFASQLAKPHFHVFVTGYTPFYNDLSSQNPPTNCQTLSVYYWPNWLRTGTTYTLTVAIRAKFNNLVSLLNDNINNAISQVNSMQESKYNNRLTFIGSVTTVFQNGLHRFCEDGVTEPDYTRTDTWYYQPAFWNSDFSDDDFPDIDAPLTEDDARSAIDSIYGTGYFDMVAQQFAQADGGNLRPWSWFVKFIVGWVRTYHPTPDGYKVQAQQTCLAICSQFPLVRGTPTQGVGFKCDAGGNTVPV